MTEENERCEESGLPKRSCHCDECNPIIIDVVSPLLEARDINEIYVKVSDLLSMLNYLRTSGFEAGMSTDARYIRIHTPLVGGCYWTRCVGCGYPFLIDQGKEAEMFCESCTRIAHSKSNDHPRYYEDLFNYIDFNLQNRRIPTGYDSELPLTEEFCEAHGFDFEVIRARLNATGGYDPGEVMLNSMWSIPWFDRLPLQRQEEDG